MAAGFGIHLGSTNSCLAVYKDGNIEVIANEAGDRTTPAAIAFSDHDKVVGIAAKQGMIRNAKNTVCHVKRLLGRDFSDDVVQNEIQKSQCKIVDKEGKPVYQVQYKNAQKQFSPEECASFIFELLKDLAKHHGDTDTPEAVLSVSNDVTEAQQQSLKSAAEKAGFKILRFIKASAASMLAYDIGQKHHHEQVHGMVVRIGGSSSSVSCFSVTNGLYKLITTTDTSELGGDMFTELIADHFAKDFLRQYKENPRDNKRSWNKLLSASQTCKHTLSNLQNAGCSVDSLHEGMDYNGNITRGRVDMMSMSLLTKLSNLMEKCLTESSLSKNQIQTVILSGGGTRLPCVSKKISDFVGSGAEVLSSISTDEVIATGAAKQAGIILSNSDNSDTSPSGTLICTQQPISATLQGSEAEVLITADHPVPVRVKRTYCSTQPSFKLVLTQGTEGNSQVIAKVLLKDVGEGAVVEAQFSLDTEGALHIACIDEKTKASCELTVPASDRPQQINDMDTS